MSKREYDPTSLGDRLTILFGLTKEDKAMKLLDDIISDLDMRARMAGEVEDGQAILDLSNGLVRRYYELKEDK